ncbi:MAG: hypothetical protein WCQ50_10435 [Spirochaetota bacterium]
MDLAMAHDIDVPQMLRAFANRNKLSEVDYRAFAQAVQRQSRQADQTSPIFRDLGINPDMVLIPRLLKAAKEKKLSLEMVGNEISKVFLPEHFASIFMQEYKRMDENPEVPFPDEDSLKIIVPSEWIQAVSLETDLTLLTEAVQERQVPLYRLVFSEGLRPFVIPSSFVPNKLTEYAVLKVRQYLRRGGNKEYLYNKLLYAFGSKEQILKDAFGLVMIRPYDAIEELKRSSSDFTFSFWAYLSSHMKKDLDKKTDPSAEDTSIYQAIVICEIFSNWYKGKAQRIIDLELAFKALETGLRKPPYYFSFDEVLDFKDSKGGPLLGKFSREELEAWLKEATTAAKAGLLPEYLIIATGKGRRSYIAKDRLFQLVLRLVGEARPDIKSRIITKWKQILENFGSLPAMDDDKTYRRELTALLEERQPLLDALLKDRLLSLVRDELTNGGQTSTEIDRFFSRGELSPIDELLDLPRKTMTVDARMLLPFWYSIPILKAIASLFLRKKVKTAKGKNQPVKKVTEEATPPSAAKDKKQDFAKAAKEIAKRVLPSEMSMEEYLHELEGRWNTMLSNDAKTNLTEDVNSLVRDYLRRTLRTMKPTSFSLERVKGMATNLANTPTLLKMKNHAALELYIQVYILRTLSK